MTECPFKGTVEFAKDERSGKLKEVHLCKNKGIEFVYCETAIRFRLCDGEVRP